MGSLANEMPHNAAFHHCCQGQGLKYTWALTRENLTSVFANNKGQTSLLISPVWSAPLLFTNWKILYLNLLQEKFQFLASLCSWAGWFKSHMVGNPEDRFSRVTAHLKVINLKSLTCDPLKSTRDHHRLIISNQMEEFIGIQRVNSFYLCLRLTSPNYAFMRRRLYSKRKVKKNLLGHTDVLINDIFCERQYLYVLRQ